MSGPAITALPVQVLDDSGDPVAGAKIFAYSAGTTNALDTYTTSALSSANANPIVADSAGRFTAYLKSQAYKFVYKTSGDVTIRTVDNYIPNSIFSGTNTDITGTAGETIASGKCIYLSDGSGSKTGGRWYLADADEEYSSLELILGFSTEVIASGASGTIRTGGVASGLSGLTAGTRYYVSATAGALTATAPTLERSVGWAMSVSTLMISFMPADLAGAVVLDHIAIEVFS
jgi:hypothetical protein